MKIRAILVPLDFSEHSAAVLEQALDLAKAFGARLHLLHCYEIPSPGVAEYQVQIPDTIWERIREAATRRIGDALEQATRAGVEATSEVREESPADAIPALARKLGVDLIVMGTHGHTGLKHVLFGSVAERTVRTAPCNVWTVKVSGTSG